MHTSTTFVQQIQPVINALVAALVPIIGVGSYLIIAKMRVLISQLQMNHAAAQQAAGAAQEAAGAAQEAAKTAAVVQQTIVEKTNGINEKLVQRADDHARALIDAKNAEIHAKDTVIETLKAKINGG